MEVEEIKISNLGIWKWTRLSFCINIGMLLAGILFSIVNDVYYLIYYSTIVSTFVLSINHLIKYKKKAFAVTALIFSGVQLLLILMGFIIGYIIGSMQIAKNLI